MGLLDKAKEQATKVAHKAQEGVKAGQEKIEDVQVKRKTEALMRDLGSIVYAQRTGTPEGDPEAEISRIVAEIQELEAQAAD